MEHDPHLIIGIGESCFHPVANIYGHHLSDAYAGKISLAVLDHNRSKQSGITGDTQLPIRIGQQPETHSCREKLARHARRRGNKTWRPAGDRSLSKTGKISPED